MMQVESSLAAGQSNGNSPNTSPSLLIQQALEAIARISKGFNANLCTRIRPEIGMPPPFKVPQPERLG